MSETTPQTMQSPEPSEPQEPAESPGSTGTTEPSQTGGSGDPTAPTDEPRPTEPTDSAGEVLGADQPGQASTTVKDPSEWVTGSEPMTGAQRSYLDTLARAAGEQLPADLNKAQASEHIERLQAKTGRGAS
jgi:hypothetical protein